MKGLELSRRYYEEHGAPMLEAQFPQLLEHLAIGLIGSGSECLGYDDEVSRDHDFEPGFCLFLPDEDAVDRRTAFLLERAYAALPREFLGFRRSLLAPVGGPRHGVLRTAEFFGEKIGSPDGALTLAEWLRLPSWALRECVSGAIFRDDAGQVTAIRERLRRYPEDVRKKKLAGSLLMMAQAGQYNYARCLRHGEAAAAQLAAIEFAQHAIHVIFLLNQVYEPYYKWCFRALRALPKLSLEAELLEYLLTTDNSAEIAESKQDVIEGIAADVIDELQAQALTQAVCGDLEKHAYSVNDAIGDNALRSLHVLAGL